MPHGLRGHGVRVHLNLTAMQPRGIDGDALRRIKAGKAGVEIEIVPVQRADDVVAAYAAVAQLSAAERTVIVDHVGVAAVSTAHQGQVALVHAHDYRLLGREIGGAHDRDPTRHAPLLASPTHSGASPDP